MPKHNQSKVIGKILISFGLTLATLTWISWGPLSILAQAQTEEEVLVTASVEDTQGPTAPILIAPENESSHTTTPSFVWKESTDYSGVASYQLILNGEILIGEITTTSGSTAQYQLTYDQATGTYTLTLLQDLEPGQYTWKIVAVDGLDFTTESEEWSFFLGLAPTSGPTTPPEETGLLPGPISRPISDAVNALPPGIKRTVENTAPYSGLLATALPFLTALLVALQTGFGFSIAAILRMLQAFGLIPKGKNQGLVYSTENNRPVPFAVLTIISESKSAKPTQETVITDVHGVYGGIKLIPNTYRLSVAHQDFLFPTVIKRPPYLEAKDYYRGEPFTISSEKESKLFLIPVDPKTKSGEKTSLMSRFHISLTRLSSLTEKLVLPMFVITGIIAIVSPSVINWIVFGLYLVSVAFRAAHWFKTPILSGSVTDDLGKPISEAVVRLSDSGVNELSAVTTTDLKGQYKLFNPKGKYTLNVTKPGMVWVDNRAAMSSYEVDLTKGAQELDIKMQPAEQIYKDLFG